MQSLKELEGLEIIILNKACLNLLNILKNIRF